jgi:hypothetical protein
VQTLVVPDEPPKASKLGFRSGDVEGSGGRGGGGGGWGGGGVAGGGG